jgi:hypothetical protein
MQSEKKMKIKLGFSDMWRNFKPEINWFTDFLRQYYEVEISDNPDFLIYSVYGDNYVKYNCIRIFYTPENNVPNFFNCDYALSFSLNINRNNHYRLPLYRTWDEATQLFKMNPKMSFQEFKQKKTKFCCIVVSNGSAKERITFFEKLSKYKAVDSGGRFLNNVGGPVKNKVDFLSDYKFNIAFENFSSSGYVTEKIVQPMLVDTIPIYWGSPSIEIDFNPKSFVNYHDYSSDEEVIDRIITLDNNDKLMEEMLAESWFNNNKANNCGDSERIFAFFKMIFETPKIPVARNWNQVPSYIMRKSKNLKIKLLKSISK